MYTHIGFIERERIGLLRAARVKISEVARRLGRDATTIRRELRRSRPFFRGYIPSTAEKDAQKKREIPRRQKKLDNPRLWRVVREKLKKR